ncbi:hypothetical protein E4Z66_06245 [Aliishimia ponticola]|uniref:Uncharacterized protein n=1 Tax=Aliishimia ponticola TaxID=2499833 RepID=A0A4S4NHI2_9RHOB|nr:hypothetical protein [Aliishimia ponticola]THH39144.1 hypothetical protein E4Z66_06245 [Aliishimia ponticola]
MDILKTANDWARAEMFSSAIFILFGALFLAASFGFWQMGRTDVARAFVLPALMAGVLLVILGGGLFYGAQKALAGHGAAYAADPPGFIASELTRVEATMAQYSTAVFKVMPLIIILSAALVMLLQGPIWRASLITTIAMITVVMLVDTNANARLAAYRDVLLSAKSAP